MSQNGQEPNESVIQSGDQKQSLEELIPPAAVEFLEENRQRAIPKIAKDESITRQIETAVQEKIGSQHRLKLGDSREELKKLDENSVQLVVTSPPYWSLKQYDGDEKAQLGDIEDYEEFLDELDGVWSEIHRVLEPGGRLVVVVGDVCLSRREFGRHVVFPLHSSIQEHCREIGFDNLAPIIWYKIANAQFESGGGGFLGKPYEPNAVVKNDVEYILFQRIPGGYRKPSVDQRVLSIIPKEKHQKWFQQVWRISGASSKDHPAPYPVKLAERLVRMFSFIGDTVLDPFMGTGSTNIAAAKWGRNSIGVEIEQSYFEIAEERVRESIPKQLTLVS
jgi:DNA modification methylase